MVLVRVEIDTQRAGDLGRILVLVGVGIQADSRAGDLGKNHGSADSGERHLESRVPRKSHGSGGGGDRYIESRGPGGITVQVEVDSDTQRAGT